MIYKAIYITGISGLISLLLTASAAIFRWGFHIHRGFAALTVCLALAHGLVVLYKQIKYAPGPSKPAGR